MGVKGNAILGLITLAAFIGCGLMAQAQVNRLEFKEMLLAVTVQEISEFMVLLLTILVEMILLVILV